MTVTTKLYAQELLEHEARERHVNLWQEFPSLGSQALEFPISGIPHVRAKKVRSTRSAHLW